MPGSQVRREVRQWCLYYNREERGGSPTVSEKSEFGNDSTSLILLLFVCDSPDYMKCQNHRDQSSYPALYLGISPGHFQLALFCKKIFGPERKRKLSQLSHHHHVFLLRPLTPHCWCLPMGFTSQLLSDQLCAASKGLRTEMKPIAGLAGGS